MYTIETGKQMYRSIFHRNNEKIIYFVIKMQFAYNDFIFCQATRSFIWVLNRDFLLDISFIINYI